MDKWSTARAGRWSGRVNECDQDFERSSMSSKSSGEVWRRRLARNLFRSSSRASGFQNSALGEPFLHRMKCDTLPLLLTRQRISLREEQ